MIAQVWHVEAHARTMGVMLGSTKAKYPTFYVQAADIAVPDDVVAQGDGAVLEFVQEQTTSLHNGWWLNPSVVQQHQSPGWRDTGMGDVVILPADPLRLEPVAMRLTVAGWEAVT